MTTRPERATDRTLRCDSCRIELTEPVWHEDRAYCCEGCTRGGPCGC